MTFHVGLNIVTLIMCAVTLTIASLAVLPQIKLGLLILRDSILWTALLGIVVAVGAVGWKHFHDAQQRRTETQRSTGVDAPQQMDGNPSALTSTLLTEHYSGRGEGQQGW